MATLEPVFNMVTFKPQELENKRQVTHKVNLDAPKSSVHSTPQRRVCMEEETSDLAQPAPVATLLRSSLEKVPMPVRLPPPQGCDVPSSHAPPPVELEVVKATKPALRHVTLFGDNVEYWVQGGGGEILQYMYVFASTFSSVQMNILSKNQLVVRSYI